MKLLDHLEEWLIALLMAAATLIIFIAVVHRYASGLPLPILQDLLLRLDTSWAQELTIYLFVWMAKFGAAYGVRTGIHVGVDVLVNRLPTPLQRRCILFGLLSGALFTIWVVYLAIPLGSALMCARFLQVAWQFSRGGELPTHDHAYVEGLAEDAAEGRR